MDIDKLIKKYHLDRRHKYFIYYGDICYIAKSATYPEPVVTVKGDFWYNLNAKKRYERQLKKR